MSDLISKEWLHSIGGYPEDNDTGEMFFRLFHLEPADDGSFVPGEYVHVGFCSDDGSCYAECYDKGGVSKEIVMLGFFKTKDKVLALLKALGVDCDAEKVKRGRELSSKMAAELGDLAGRRCPKCQGLMIHTRLGGYRCNLGCR